MRLESERRDTEQRPATRTDGGTEAGHSDGLGALALERGISERVLRAAGIGVNTSGGERHGWWSIPYPHRTGIWTERYRNPDPTGRPKYADRPGADFHLYNPGLLGSGEEEIWFTEGEFDTLALMELGVPALGISGASKVGNPDDEEDSGKFQVEWATLFEDTLCVIAFDNDDAGKKASRSLSQGLRRLDVSAVVFDEWPGGITDWNEWLVADREGMDSVLRGYRGRVRDAHGLA